MIARRDSRHGYRADFLRRQKTRPQTRPNPAAHQNAIAAGNTLRAQRVAHAIGERGQFAVGYFARFANDGGAPGVQSGRASTKCPAIFNFSGFSPCGNSFMERPSFPIRNEPGLLSAESLQ